MYHQLNCLFTHVSDHIPDPCNTTQNHAIPIQIRIQYRAIPTRPCTQVLHHLPDPLYGLRTLSDSLKPAGGMSIMVYPKVARTGATDPKQRSTTCWQASTTSSSWCAWSTRRWRRGRRSWTTCGPCSGTTLPPPTLVFVPFRCQQRKPHNFNLSVLQRRMEFSYGHDSLHEDDNFFHMLLLQFSFASISQTILGSTTTYATPGGTLRPTTGFATSRWILVRFGEPD